MDPFMKEWKAWLQLAAEPGIVHVLLAVEMSRVQELDGHGGFH